MELILKAWVKDCQFHGGPDNESLSLLHRGPVFQMLPRRLLCVAICALSSYSYADTIWLKNGDRITGTVTLLDGGKLMVETAYGGSIPLDWSKVATLETDRELLVKDGDRPNSGEVSKTLGRAESGKVTLHNGGEPETVELASISQIMRPRPIVQDFVWKGNIDASLDYKRADSDTDDYNVKARTEARHGLWRHNGRLDYNREATDQETTTDNYTLAYALDRFIDEQWFWQGRLDYKRDKVEDVSRQRTIGTGPGYQFWDNELGAFSLTGLVNQNEYRFSNGENKNFYSVAGKWKYNRFLVGKTFEFFTNGELSRPLDNVADYALDAEVGLRYKVTDWASLNMRAERDLVKGGSDGELDETRYLIGFGVGW